MPSLPTIVTEERLAEVLNQLREELRNEFDAKLTKLTQSKENLLHPLEFGNTMQVAEAQAGNGNGEAVTDLDSEAANAEFATQPTFKEKATIPYDKKTEITEEQAANLQRGAVPKAIWRMESARILDVEQAVVHDAHINTLKETIWESSIFIGLPQIGRCGSGLLLIILLLNIVMQAAFVVIIKRGFPSKPPNLGAVRRWRRAIGHHISQVDTFGHSLISRVCAMNPSLSVAYSQLQMLEESHQYIADGHYDGPILCVLVVIIWYLVVLRDLERTMYIMKELWLVPKYKRTRIGVSLDGRWFLNALPRGRKLFMCCVCAARASIACLLLWRGTLWLVYTASITDLVLNAVSLEFIFDIDELLYDIFVPKIAKAMLTRLDIHAYASAMVHPRDHRFAMSGLMRAASLVFFVAFVFKFSVQPHLDAVASIINITCGGNKDFVVGEHKSLGMVFYAPSREWLGSIPGQNPANIQPVIDLIRGRNTTGTSRLQDVTTLKSFVTKTSSHLADSLMPTCTDARPHILPEYWRMMEQALGMERAISCSDGQVRNACGNITMDLVRMLCPETCRCFHSKPNAALSSGCPYFLCQDNRATAGYYDTSLNCTDDANSSLATDQRWRAYWESLTAIKKLEDSSSNFTQVLDFAMTSGCSVITKYDLHEEVCAEMSNRQSLGTYCPETCECQFNDYWGCPSHCFDDNG